MAGDGGADGSNLAAIGDDDSDRLFRVEVLLFQLKDAGNGRCNHLRFRFVHLVRRSLVLRPYREESRSLRFQNPCHRVLLLRLPRQVAQLVWALCVAETVLIEEVVREVRNLRVHSSLPRQHVGNRWVFAIFLQESFKEREAAVRQQNLVETRFLDL